MELARNHRLRHWHTYDFLGLVVGLWMYSPSKRYRFRGSPSHVLYSGQMRWHLILGLTFGFVTFTWILSGMFSMDPICWPENVVEEKVENNLLGGTWNGSDFYQGWKCSLGAQAHIQVRELIFTYLAGKPTYVALKSPSEAAIFSNGSVQTSVDLQNIESH